MILRPSWKKPSGVGLLQPIGSRNASPLLSWLVCIQWLTTTPHKRDCRVILNKLIKRNQLDSLMGPLKIYKTVWKRWIHDPSVSFLSYPIRVLLSTTSPHPLIWLVAVSRWSPRWRGFFFSKLVSWKNGVYGRPATPKCGREKVATFFIQGCPVGAPPCIIQDSQLNLRSPSPCQTLERVMGIEPPT